MEIVRGSALGLGRRFGAMVHKRKIVVYIATSADGFIARPVHGMSAFHKSIDTVLSGRKTFRVGLRYKS